MDEESLCEFEIEEDDIEKQYVAMNEECTNTSLYRA